MVHRTRFAKLYALLALFLVGLLLAACAVPPPAGAPAEEAAEATAAPAEEGGEVSREETLVFAADFTDWLSFDPAVAYEFGSIQVEGSIYETLVSFEPGQPGVKPLLAESWDIQDSGDMWTITFKLNPNATFASGNPVTADDVIYSWGRAIDLNKSPAFLFIDVAKLTKENITAVDAQTVEVKLPKDSSPQVFISILSFTIGAVVEKAIVEANAGDDMGSTWLNDHSAGSGPYVLDTWERNASVTLNVNPNYWGAAPAMKRIVMLNTPEMANLQAMIETGDADIVQDLSAEQVAVLKDNPDIQLVDGLSSQIHYIGMNATKPPLDKVEVREAIRYAINYDEFISLFGGKAHLVQEVIPIGFLGHTGNNPFTQDIAKAQELLAQAGVAEGTEIELLVPTGPSGGGVEWSTLAAKIQNDVAQIGLTINIKQLQTSELLNIYRAQEGQMIGISWGPDFPDPDGNATPFANYEANSLAWRNAWNDPQAIELSQQAAIELDEATRVELYAELTEYVQHQGPYIFLYQATRTYGLRSNVTGFVFDPVDSPNVTFALISKQ